MKLILRTRKQGDVKSEQLLVVVSGAMLQKYTTDRVAVVACFTESVGDVIELVPRQAVVYFPERRLLLLGSQAIVVAEVLHDFAHFGGSRSYAVKTHHAFNVLFPDFRRGANVGNPAHHSVLIP